MTHFKKQHIKDYRGEERLCFERELLVVLANGYLVRDVRYYDIALDTIWPEHKLGKGEYDLVNIAKLADAMV